MLKTISVFVLLTLSHIAHGVIIDHDYVIDDSFLDTETGLVWMDYGVNNGMSFNEVMLELNVGGLYEEWRLPTTDEVYRLWESVIALDIYTPTSVYSSFLNPSNPEILDRNPSSPYFNTIGQMTADTPTLTISSDYSAVMWFQGTYELAATSVSISFEKFYLHIYDGLSPSDPNYQSVLADPDVALDYIGTYLVYKQDVNEPTTIAILLIALVMLMRKRLFRLK
ncbi:hypothetical protein [Alteromonas oceanisediminis]|uniref:hypothetical protein n=1 Tax=Alteromonas oceanisediminis TaxID=2836180 RepID=UPI001BD9C26F|nr:hypothetical protein [Alteromonas oceanisediminis]MBT0587953.1 hypothetical protein [Alteromonas oceanisediminis]